MELPGRAPQAEWLPASSVPPPSLADAAAQRPEGAARTYVMDEHLLPLTDLADRLGVRIDAEDPRRGPGLTRDLAASRLRELGPNRLTPPRSRPEWLKFLLKFTDVFMVMLLAAGALSFASYAANPDDDVNFFLGLVLVVIVRDQANALPRRALGAERLSRSIARFPVGADALPRASNGPPCRSMPVGRAVQSTSCDPERTPTHAPQPAVRR